MPHQCTNCGKTFADGSKEMLSGCPDCGGNKFQFQPSGTNRSSTSDPSKPAAESADSSTEPAAGSATSAPGSARDESTPEAGRDRREPEEAAAEREIADPADESASAETRDGAATDAAVEEDRAQRDARTANATADELDEARREMAEAEDERLSEVDNGEEGATGRPKRGRGTPQGPPTEPPGEEAAEEFGLSGAVGPPDDQPRTPAEESSRQEPMGGSDTDLSALREELNDQFESIKITAPGQYELNLMELYDRKEYIISLQEDGRYVVDIPEGHTLEE